MSQTLSLKNFPSANILNQTRLTADVASTATSLTVDNCNDFAVGPVLVGAPGERSELLTSTSVSTPTTLPLSAGTKLDHNANEPVYSLFGDQVRVYSAADQYGTGQQPDDSNFSLVSTVNIDGSREATQYTDSAGATGTWYKYTFYNSTSTDETALADSVAVQAGQVHFCELDDIRDEAGFNDAPSVTNDKIARAREQAEKEIIGALVPVYQFPLPQPTNPIIHLITRKLAAGLLMESQYMPISPQMAAEGTAKAAAARNGSESHAGLIDLVSKAVVLTDATFTDTTIEGGHGVGGYPDATANNFTGDSSDDERRQFSVNEVY